MKISFVIIAFNAEENIRRVIPSIINIRPKFNTEVEVVFVDDGSSDQTLHNVEKFQEHFDIIKIVTNETNKGRAYSRNVGMENSDGDYVFFIDSDDYLAPAYFNEIEQYLSLQHDVVAANRIDVHVDSEAVFSGHHTLKLYLPFFEVTSALSCPQCFQDNFITGKFYRTKFLRENGITFSTKRKNAEDILFSTEVWLKARSIRFCREPFYVYSRGNYKKGFNEEKCRDVLVNLSQLRELLPAEANREAMKVLASKYANGIVETIKRGGGVLHEATIANLIETHFEEESFFGLSDSDFLDHKSENVIRLMRQGAFTHAVEQTLKTTK